MGSLSLLKAYLDADKEGWGRLRLVGRLWMSEGVGMGLVEGL